MAHQRPLGIVEVPAAGMDQAATLIGRLFLPFGHDVIIGFNFEEPLENQREGLGGRFLEGQNLHEMIAQPQMPAMAFEVGLAQVPVKKRIVLEASGFELAGIEVQDALEDSKGLLLPEDFGRAEVANLEDEVAGLAEQGGAGALDLGINQDHLVAAREISLELPPRLARLGAELRKARDERLLIPEALEEDDEIDFQGIEGFGLAPQKLDPALNGCVNDRAAVGLVGNLLAIGFQKVLVDPALFIEDSEGGFQALGEIINRRRFEAFVIHSPDFQHHACIAALRQENLVVNKSEQVHLFVE